jgi:crotonobetainyl-CoA:carnitine CoA-transferase CaiB-like acyl-CoA transferase
MSDKKQKRPLDGIRVIEMGQLLAGPFTGSILSYFGAEVIKVESPNRGDPLRSWRMLDEEGTSYWWRSISRNKKCVTIDLKTDRGQELVRELADRADVILENFKPGTMEKWGLEPDVLWKTNPGLIYARISGYGQTGPYSSRAGFASACEGFGGFRYLNGFPGEAPVRPNLSLGDTLTAIHAALGILLAYIQREKDEDGRGQVVDVAIYEAVFNMLEAVVPEYVGTGAIRGPSGTTITGIAPTNTYACKDGKYVVIGGNGDSIFKRLMEAAGRSDLGEDPRLGDNAGRVEHQEEVDQAISQWTSSLDSGDLLNALERASVPAGPIYNVEDMLADEHYNARGMFQNVEINGKPFKLPAMVPILSETPGRTDWPGPALASHNQEIYGDLLGMDPAEIDALKTAGVI